MAVILVIATQTTRGTEESNVLNAKKPPSEVDLVTEIRSRILPLFNELKFEHIFCNK
jgi:hypothetical protein